MKLLIFTEGTILMHENAKGCAREEIVQQARDKEESIYDYASYIPVNNAIDKVKEWQSQGHQINYLTSRKKEDEINDIKNVLEEYGFPKGELYYREEDEEYIDVVKRASPDVLIEDDCESIDKEDVIKSKLNQHTRGIIVKEFGGIEDILL